MRALLSHDLHGQTDLMLKIKLDAKLSGCMTMAQPPYLVSLAKTWHTLLMSSYEYTGRESERAGAAAGAEQVGAAGAGRGWPLLRRHIPAVAHPRRAPLQLPQVQAQAHRQPQQGTVIACGLLNRQHVTC